MRLVWLQSPIVPVRCEWRLLIECLDNVWVALSVFACDLLAECVRKRPTSLRDCLGRVSEHKCGSCKRKSGREWLYVKLWVVSSGSNVKC